LYYNAEQAKMIESMLLKEMGAHDRIMVRSLDKIHARTGLTYAMISEIARCLQERGFITLPAAQAGQSRSCFYEPLSPDRGFAVLAAVGIPASPRSNAAFGYKAFREYSGLRDRSSGYSRIGG
jgi:hypothetical protein